MPLPSRHLVRPLIVAAVLLVVVLVGMAGYLEQWLWMRQLDYAGIFWTLLSVRWSMFCSAFVFAFLYLWINLRHAAKKIAPRPVQAVHGALIYRERLFFPEPTQSSCLPGH
jgi:uncharacterized membrane protein (UPF0182 family)